MNLSPAYHSTFLYFPNYWHLQWHVLIMMFPSEAVRACPIDLWDSGHLFQGLSLPESRPLSHWETNPCLSLSYVSFLSCSSGFLVRFVSVLVGNWNHIPVPWSGGNKPLALLAEYWKYCSLVTSSSAWSVQMSVAQLSKHTDTCSSPLSFLSSRSLPSKVFECCCAQGLT